MNKKALIAMSGGVDSSVAAYLMFREGYTCIGSTMKLYRNEEIGLKKENTCCSLNDITDARQVAFRLNMPYYIFNFTEDFEKYVIQRFIKTYEEGMTPNPCIDCNHYLKFGRFYRRAKEIGCDYVVTGHYARIEQDENSGRYLLKKAVDKTKDQSYVLYTMTQDQLAHTKFPLGEFLKSKVRQIAADQGFLNARKHDSQDICFVPNGDYAAFIEQYLGRQYPQGEFTDRDGRVLGKHKGFIRYTIGQRKGLGISHPTPLYVCQKCRETNTVVLGENRDLYAKTLTADHINFISCDYLEKPKHLAVRIRYRQKEQPALVSQLDEFTVRVDFDEPQRAITPGQSAVFYDGDLVVGGGIIFQTK